MKKTLLKLFMTVAGDHAENDISGRKDNSLTSLPEKSGVDVIVDLTGSGVNNDFACLYVDT